MAWTPFAILIARVLSNDHVMFIQFGWFTVHLIQFRTLLLFYRGFFLYLFVKIHVSRRFVSVNLLALFC